MSCVGAALLLASPWLAAQYAIERSVIAAGGGSGTSTDGRFAATTTTGEPLAPATAGAGGNYAIDTGLLAQDAGAPADPLFRDGFE